MGKYIITGLMLLLIIVRSYGQQSPLEFGNSSYYLKWLEPISKVKEVGKHEKLELGIIAMEGIGNKINEYLITGKEGINPYNPEEISVEVTFVSPSHQERTIYGFYYEAYQRSGEAWQKAPTKYNWRVRFAPDEVGKWTFSIKIITKDKTIESLGTKFECVESTNKGVLRKDEENENARYLHLSETNEPFFTIGHNITHSAYYKLTPEKAERHKQWLTELAENGGNFFRLEMGAQNALPDWSKYDNYSKKMPHMWEFDGLVEHAQDLGLYFILFRHHTEVMDGESWDVSNWHNNPYRIGFDLNKRKMYFTNTDVIKWQKNALRYIFSRWGYSTSFAFYEYQEIDNWVEDLMKEEGYDMKKAVRFMKNWYLGQKSYITDELGYNKLFINTYASTPEFEYKKNKDGMFAESDLIGFHKYGQNKQINYSEKYDKAIRLFENWKKPLFVEEMGTTAGGDSEFLPLYKCSGVEFHNSIWSTSFMGTAGTGMVWWWDRGIHDFEYYKDYKALAAFFADEKFDSKQYTPQKWHSKLSIRRALIENYALSNSDNSRVIGWVHNATNYWRNIESPCLQELQEKGFLKEPHQLEDGVLLGKKQDIKTDFKKDADAYSNKGGVQDVSNQVFKIKGLKSGGLFGKAHWYEVNYYSTITGKMVLKQIHKTSAGGKLKLKYPDINEPDFSYKITHLGQSKKQPE